MSLRSSRSRASAEDESSRATPSRARASVEALHALKQRQHVIDDASAEILRGVYELERRPDGATRRRLARQIGATEEAVNAWFRARRAKAKRDRGKKILFLAVLLAALGTGIYFLVNVARQESYARRRVNALGRRYKWLTRSGLPRPYNSGKNKAVRDKPLTYEKERVVTAGGKEEVRNVMYTKNNPKSSPITRAEETPRQKLERLRVEASKKANKGRIKATPQPTHVRQPSST